jgi:lysylphosphatidylglycerol synthetase-like protein (DUF2156 family)
VALCGWWTFAHTEYADQSVMKTIGDHEVARAIRSSAAAAIVLMAIGVWRLIATAATPPVVDDTDPDFDRVRAILAKAEDAEPGANLALLGDKRFLFSASGESFLMFGVRGRSWIAMGAPVGRDDERMELFWRFRELADAHAARAGFYALGPTTCPTASTWAWPSRRPARAPPCRWRPSPWPAAAARSCAATGARPGRAARPSRSCRPTRPYDHGRAEGDLRRLAGHHAGGEKSFSMGGFDPRYVAEFPVAVVRVEEGKIVAFATLWTTASQGLVLDGPDALLRRRAQERHGLPVRRAAAVGQGEGYQAFEFGMAPLAGLEDRPLAPIMSRVGRLLYERGEEIYNFQGVRRYKDKYDPVWQPRYIAAPHKWAIPFLLADIGLLSSGGVGPPA